MGAAAKQTAEACQGFFLEPKVLAACAPAMGKQEGKAYSKGVHIYVENDHLVYEATNGHFLIRVKSYLEHRTEHEYYDLTDINIIVPDFFVKELAKPAFLKGFGCVGTEFVTAVLSGQTISVEMPDGIISNRLVEDSFPNLGLIIPSYKTCRDKDFDYINFNFGYMSEISKSLKALGRSAAGLAFTGGNTSPVHLMTDIETDTHSFSWEALVMPLMDAR